MLRALTGSIPAGDVLALLTLVSYARPTRVLELGATTGHMTANLTEWTDLETVIVSVSEVCHSELDHFGKSGKVQIVEDISGNIKPFELIVIHESANFDRLLSDTKRAYQLLSPGGLLVCLGFCPTEVPSPVRDAIESAQFPERVFHFAGTRLAYLQKAPPVPRRTKSLAIRWEGDVDVLHSLAAVNRALVDRLQMLGHLMSVAQTHSVPASAMRERHPSHFAIARQLQKTPDVVIRHSWPPVLERSSDGAPVVLIQPWEFGSPPKEWVESLRRGNIAEWWVPSEATRQGAIKAGVPEDRVAVVPNGVHISLFRPKGEALPLKTRKRFKYLFVGGTIWRKGFDLLLKAYAEAFSALDDVCLVVKDSGVSTHYQGQTAEKTILQFQQMADAPELEYHPEDLTDTEMAQLYRAADCLVHPYRGESFAMPVAEAMACGKPVIVTQSGSTDDWCDEQNAFLIPAVRVSLPPGPVCGMETVGEAWYLEPSLSALIDHLRFVVENPGQNRIKGQNAFATIRNRLTWDHAARSAEKRLQRFLAKRSRRLGQRVSLTMIVRNEESNLKDCLGWINALFDEIVIVDTGSTDRTKEIAATFGAKIFDYPWSDSFADARNEAIKHAMGDWIFWLDADDRLDADNRQKLEALFNSLRDEQAAFLMTCHCQAEPGGIESGVDHIRLFRRRDHIRWRYRVHEQILPALQETDSSIHWSDVVITHVGYTDPELVSKKLKRDRRLLNQEFEERPSDSLVLFQLGVISKKMGQPSEAIFWLEKSLHLSQPGDSILPKIYVLLAQCHRELGQPVRAMEIVQTGHRLFLDNVELLYLKAILHQESNEFSAAENCFRQLFQTPGTRQIGSVTDGLRGYLGRHALARLLFQCGRFQAALDEWQEVIRERPDFQPAICGLEESLQRVNWNASQP